MEDHETPITTDGPDAQARQLEDWLVEQRTNIDRRRRIGELLLQLVAIDTTPRTDLIALRDAERAVFDIIESRLAACSPDLRAERVPIDARIVEHAYYTEPFYAQRSEPTALEVAQAVYRDRCNLFVRLPAAGQPRLVLNAHVDVVAPYFPGRIEGDTVIGRGSADDKGPLTAILTAVELICEAQSRLDLKLKREVVLQFVIDEETGGNGSLSAALDRRRSECEAIVVSECTGMGIHPGNRGVVWYQVTLKEQGHETADRANASSRLLEAMAYVVEALEQCGQDLKARSEHPLFPHRPVQTCHGILGSFGQHPSRVQDYVALDLAWDGSLGELVRQTVERSLAGYCQHYGDKTVPGAGDAVLEKHVRWSQAGENHAVLEVFGLAGHMGSVARLDGAITKAAWIIRDLVAARRGGDQEWSALGIRLHDEKTAKSPSLALEGGQGFLPTHNLEEVSAGMRRAVSDAVHAYLAKEGLPADMLVWDIGFEKLHNDAFARPAHGPVVRALVDSARRAGIEVAEPLRGWDVSCDARIFAREFPQAEVITFGPGRLSLAHSNQEHIELAEILQTAEALARLVFQLQ